MRSIVALAMALLAFFAAPVQARQVVYEVITEEEWVETPGQAPVRTSVTTTVRTLSETDAQPAVRVQMPRSERFVAAQSGQLPQIVADYGPFRIVDGKRAALISYTDARTPAHFAAMLRDYPELEVLDLVEVPGTADDGANMQLGRMIRAAGLSTHVPAGGSVRSGGVELFLAGATRQIEDGAQFAVHSWMDRYGRQAKDFAANAPQNRAYVDYYREMGMSEEEARAFYDMTNSVPFSQAKWLDARDMRGWLPGDAAPAAEKEAAPKLAYLDLEAASF
ncbi:MAG: alpha/beta hydrolase [Sphingomonadaceae bacterium]|nr:alpha/beta hydrolase [Sphingomonadaceae bacterium]